MFLVSIHSEQYADITPHRADRSNWSFTQQKQSVHMDDTKIIEATGEALQSDWKKNRFRSSSASIQAAIDDPRFSNALTRADSLRKTSESRMEFEKKVRRYKESWALTFIDISTK